MSALGNKHSASSGTVDLDEIAQFLDCFFSAHRFSNEASGVYRPATHSIERFGLALEPWPQISQWASRQRLDALFLHRPWKLEPQMAPHVGVVAYHLAFDERLTLGFNLRLAEVLGMSAVSVLGKKEGRPIGMLGEVSTQSFDRCRTRLNEVFGGQDEARAGENSEVSRVAVVGAMTEALVREAASQGANLYITGQMRQPAQAAVLETGISVVCVGHRRCEEWGLRALAGVMGERWSRLKVILPALD